MAYDIKSNNKLIDVDWGGHSLLFGPAKRHEWNLFTWVILRTIEHMFLLTSRQMFSTALSKLRAKHFHNMMDFKITFVTQKFLLCNLQITRDSVSWSLYAAERLFMHDSHVFCEAAPSICLNCCCFCHVPHDIALITVRYHTEADKLKLKTNWLCWKIMAFSFK